MALRLDDAADIAAAEGGEAWSDHVAALRAGAAALREVAALRAEVVSIIEAEMRVWSPWSSRSAREALTNVLEKVRPR